VGKPVLSESSGLGSVSERSCFGLLGLGILCFAVFL
jgi:hypothetical protein